MNWLHRRCEIHEVPSAVTVAHLERDLGIDPDAVTRHQAEARSFFEAYANPALIDCGNRRCRSRR